MSSEFSDAKTSAVPCASHRSAQRPEAPGGSSATRTKLRLINQPGDLAIRPNGVRGNISFHHPATGGLRHGKMSANSGVRYKINTNDRSRSSHIHWIFRLGLAQGARGRARPAARGPNQADEGLPRKHREHARSHLFRRRNLVFADCRPRLSGAPPMMGSRRSISSSKNGPDCRPSGKPGQKRSPTPTLPVRFPSNHALSATPAFLRGRSLCTR
jgi:hypothetical protein